MWVIIHALDSFELSTSLIAVRPLESPSWLCSWRNWGLVRGCLLLGSLEIPDLHVVPLWCKFQALCSAVALAGAWYKHPVGPHTERDLVSLNSKKRVCVL